MLITLIILGILNFALGIGYLLLRSRRYDFPFWLYLLAVLFCWAPGAVYLLIFYRERSLQPPTDASRQLYTMKISLGWLVFLLPGFMQAGLSFLINPQLSFTVHQEIPEICALTVSAGLSCMLLVCIRFMEQAATRTH